MPDFISKLFDTTDFPARWHCGVWTDEHGWLHIVSDLGIFGAYIAIPILLAATVLKRRDAALPLPLPRITGLFIAFILLCGVTHLNEAIIFWQPVYRWAGAVKLATAVASWGTVAALIPALPKALALRTPRSLQEEVESTTKQLREERDAASRELSARERAERALLETEARYRDLYDNGPDMYFSVDARSGLVLQYNRTAAERLGVSEADLIGTPLTELYAPESQDVASKALEHLTETGSLTDVELTALTRSGERVQISLRATAVRDENGVVVESRSAWRDISEKKQAEALFAVAVEASPSAMIATDDDGTIALMNAEGERLFGYQREELLGRPIEVLIPETYRKKHPELRRGFSKNPTSRKMGENRSLSALKKDGTTFPIEVGLNPIETLEGKMILAAIVDRTDVVLQQEALKKQRAELARSNEDLESYAYAVSHDLKAPLRALQNAATWIEEDLPRDLLTDDMKENLDMLRGRAVRMERLLNALLEYARAGRSDSADVEVEIPTLVNEIVEFLGLPDAVNIHINANGAEGLHTARAPLHQVLSNLISNASRHGEGRTRNITVSAHTGRSEVEFSVADDGPGIPPSLHRKIFEVFQTLRPRDDHESTGIGLALVKKVVESRGGRVWVESVPEQGATFYFTWPITTVSSPLTPANTTC